MHKALIVCNSQYPRDPVALPRLLGPKSDGLVMWSALTNADTGIFDRRHAFTLFEHSHSDILTSAEDFFASAGPSDTLLFYFSGHGLRSVDRELYLCANDTQSARLFSSAVSADVLSKIVQASKAPTKVLILDCCHSGAFKGSRQIADDLSGDGRYVIAAVRASEEARDAEEEGLASPFTRCLVSALESTAQDANSDGLVDLDDVYRAVSKVKKEFCFNPQKSFLGSGQVALARRAELPREPDESSEVEFGRSVIAAESFEQMDVRTARKEASGAQNILNVTDGNLGARLRYQARMRGDKSVGDLLNCAVVLIISLLGASYSLASVIRWPRPGGQQGSFERFVVLPTEMAILSGVLNLLVVVICVAELSSIGALLVDDRASDSFKYGRFLKISNEVALRLLDSKEVKRRGVLRDTVSLAMIVVVFGPPHWL